MAEGDKKQSRPRISEAQRLRYIGFEVFPGKPKDLFKNDAEKNKHLDRVKKRFDSDDTLREECTLLVERVTFGERIVLTVASVCILAALLLPWYSAYTIEKDDTPVAAAVEPLGDSAAMALAAGDSLATGIVDSLTGMAVAAEETVTGTDTPEEATELAAAVEGESEVAADEAAPAEDGSGTVTHRGERANEEIITGHQMRAKTVKIYTELSGLETFAALGNVGSYLFGSGIVVIVSGLLMLVCGLLCIGLPVLNLYGIYGLKGRPDEKAIKLKSYLRFNWLPLILLSVVVFLSFFGADYGFDSTETFASLGDSYSIGALFNSLSWGILVALASSILVAAKGMEI